MLLLTSLGFHLSWQKCQLLPVQTGRFLGLIVDTAQCKLVVPQDKVDRIKSSIERLLQRQQATSRELACVAVMLMSASPALYMAPLYLRSLYQTMQPGEGWDVSVMHFDLTVEDLQYWLDTIDI